MSSRCVPLSCTHKSEISQNPEQKARVVFVVFYGHRNMFCERNHVVTKLGHFDNLVTTLYLQLWVLVILSPRGGGGVAP